MLYDDQRQPLIRLIIDKIYEMNKLDIKFRNIYTNENSFDKFMDKIKYMICKNNGHTLYINVVNEKIVSIVYSIQTAVFNKRIKAHIDYKFNLYTSYEMSLGYCLEQNLSVNELEKVLFEII